MAAPGAAAVGWLSFGWSSTSTSECATGMDVMEKEQQQRNVLLAEDMYTGT